jgi:hypothetical protein
MCWVGNFSCIAFSNSPDLRMRIRGIARMFTLYDRLGVKQDADVRDIRLAYLRQAKLYHPDKNSGDAAALEQFSDVKVAYEFLRDGESRKLYDARLADIRWRARKRMLRNSSIYAAGFLATFGTVFLGARSLVPDRQSQLAEVVDPPVMRSPHDRAPDAISPPQVIVAMAGPATTPRLEPDRTNSDIAQPADHIAALLGAPRGEEALEQAPPVRPPPAQLVPQVPEFEPPSFVANLAGGTTGAAGHAVIPYNPATPPAPMPNTREVRVWARYFDDAIGGSPNPNVRVFIVEHEDADVRSANAPIETTASAAPPMRKREVRVRGRFRGSGSEIHMTPQVITIEHKEP